MTKVVIDYWDKNECLIKIDELNTTADSAFVFDDISGHMHKNGEFADVPKGTKKIIIRIDCDF